MKRRLLLATVLSLAAGLVTLGMAVGAKPADPVPWPIFRVTLEGPRLIVEPANLPVNTTAWWSIVAQSDKAIDLYLNAAHEGKGYSIRYTLPLGGQPGPQPKPEPQPDPKPKPDPNPQPVPQKLACVVVEESKARTPEQGIVLASPKVRALFKGSDFRIYDPVADSGQWRVPPTDLAPYVERAKGKTLPQVYLVDEKGIIRYENGLPKTVADFEALVESILKGVSK